jgi:hypothetical protein
MNMVRTHNVRQYFIFIFTFTRDHVLGRAVPRRYIFSNALLSTLLLPTSNSFNNVKIINMNTAHDPPKTPPHSVYPLIPPSTGQSVKLVRFADLAEIDSGSKRLKQHAESDVLSRLSKQIQENTSDRADKLYTDASLPTEGESATQIATPSVTPVHSRKSIIEKNEFFASLAVAIDTPILEKPFPFMKLPLAIRTRIYEHLVVVPAIICVRQNHTAFHKERQAILYAERRELLPGIAYALTQLTVDGHKSRFSQLAAANVNILRVSKQVHAEAKPIMYSKNEFEIIKPTREMASPVDFSVPLFPSGYQRLVTKLNVRIRSFYDLSWLLGGGYNAIKNYYRGLRTLTLILEMDSSSKSYGKMWSRHCGEEWPGYVQRLQGVVAQDLSGRSKLKNAKKIPVWINLRVLFTGEAYEKYLIVPGDDISTLGDDLDGLTKRSELKRALPEVWELLKKSSSATGPAAIGQ